MKTQNSDTYRQLGYISTELVEKKVYVVRIFWCRAHAAAVFVVNAAHDAAHLVDEELLKLSPTLTWAAE